MILYVVGGSCYIKTNDIFILGIQDVRRFGVESISLAINSVVP